MISLTVSGQIVQLLPDRALSWPSEQALLLADMHLGKAQVFRDHGIALPRGTSSRDLQRLDRLIDLVGARELIVLGDFVHGPYSADAAWVQVFRDWRSTRKSLKISVISGNHDRFLHADTLGLDRVVESEQRQSLLLNHEPLENTDSFVLCGHLHPCQMLKLGRQRCRTPIFWLQKNQLILPAWGGMTGTMLIQPQHSDRLYAALDDAVVELPR